MLTSIIILPPTLLRVTKFQPPLPARVDVLNPCELATPEFPNLQELQNAFQIPENILCIRVGKDRHEYHDENEWEFAGGLGFLARLRVETLRVGLYHLQLQWVSIKFSN